VTRFVIQPQSSLLRVLAHFSLHDLAVAGEVTGHLEVDVSSGRLDLASPVSGLVMAALEDLRGDEPRFAPELRRRLDTHRFPKATARLESAVAGSDGQYDMTGALSLHGVERQVSGTAAVEVSGTGSLRLQGWMSLDVRDFGIVPPKLLVLKMNPTVELALDVLAEPEPAAAA
jgi:hypothetical protein